MGCRTVACDLGGRDGRGVRLDRPRLRRPAGRGAARAARARGERPHRLGRQPRLREASRPPGPDAERQGQARPGRPLPWSRHQRRRRLRDLRRSQRCRPVQASSGRPLAEVPVDLAEVLVPRRRRPAVPAPATSRASGAVRWRPGPLGARPRRTWLARAGRRRARPASCATTATPTRPNRRCATTRPASRRATPVHLEEASNSLRQAYSRPPGEPWRPQTIDFATAVADPPPGFLVVPRP